MEHRINSIFARKFKDMFVIILDIFFLRTHMVGIVHKISTLHIHIRGTDCLQSFSLWTL